MFAILINLIDDVHVRLVDGDEGDHPEAAVEHFDAVNVFKNMAYVGERSERGDTPIVFVIHVVIPRKDIPFLCVFFFRRFQKVVNHASNFNVGRLSIVEKVAQNEDVLDTLRLSIITNGLSGHQDVLGSPVKPKMKICDEQDFTHE